jgi:hypothetical protein
MANQMAMSRQARRVGPVVATGISLATTGILVAGPTIAPYVAAREAQVVAAAPKALSAAQVNLAAAADVIAAALLAFQDGGPVGAVLGGVGQALGGNDDPPTPLGAAVLAFQGGGPLGVVLTGVGTGLGGDTPLGAALLNFQGGGPVGAVLFGLAAGNEGLTDIVTAFQSGGPVGAVLQAIAGALPTTPPPPTPPADGAMTLAAQREASTPVTSVRGLFGRNAEANTGRSFVDLATPSLAGRGNQSDPTIEAEAPKPFRDALPKPFKAVQPDAPAVDVPKGPVAAVRDKTDAGTKGSGDGKGLIRNSLQFKPDTTLWGDGESGGGGGGPLQGIKEAIGKLTGGGGLKGDAKG